MKTILDAIWLCFLALLIALAWPWLKDDEEENE